MAGDLIKNTPSNQDHRVTTIKELKVMALIKNKRLRGK